MKTQEAFEKQKQDAELRMQEEEEKSKQIIPNHEDKMKEHMHQKKKKKHAQVAEIEECRTQEEAAHLAKLKNRKKSNAISKQNAKRNRKKHRGNIWNGRL